MAVSNFDASYYTSHLNEDDESDAWLSIIEQCYQKGKLSLPQNDFHNLEQEYIKIKSKIKSSKLKDIVNKIYPIAFIVIGLLLVLTKIIAIGVVGIALAIVGIVILSTNRKKCNAEKTKINTKSNKEKHSK